MDPERADFVLGGALLFSVAMEALRFDDVLVSTSALANRHVDNRNVLTTRVLRPLVANHVFYLRRPNHSMTG